MGNAHLLRIAGIAAAAALVAGAGAARADTSWNLSNAGSCAKNVAGIGCTAYHFTANDGTTVTGAAYHADSRTAGASLDYLGIYSPWGLGVEDAMTPQHAVDNNRGYDFVVFKFDSPFDVTSITLDQWNSTQDYDMDATILFGAPTSGTPDATGFAGKSIADLLADGGFKQVEDDNGPDSHNEKSVTLSSTGQDQYLIVAASLAKYYGDSYWHQHSDYFKIKSITGTASPPSTSVPEPSTLALLLVGALGICGSRRFRRGAAA